MWTPSTRPLSRSATTLTTPRVLRLTIARGAQRIVLLELVVGPPDDWPHPNALPRSP
jgi:hypothetical protein